MSEIRRTITLYKDYFSDFYKEQKQKVKDKILWTFRIIETQQQVPTDYLKHTEGTDGLYEIRVQQDSDIFRIFWVPLRISKTIYYRQLSFVVAHSPAFLCVLCVILSVHFVVKLWDAPHLLLL